MKIYRISREDNRQILISEKAQNRGDLAAEKLYQDYLSNTMERDIKMIVIRILKGKYIQSINVKAGSYGFQKVGLLVEIVIGTTPQLNRQSLMQSLRALVPRIKEEISKIVGVYPDIKIYGKEITESHYSTENEYPPYSH